MGWCAGGGGECNNCIIIAQYYRGSRKGAEMAERCWATRFLGSRKGAEAAERCWATVARAKKLKRAFSGRDRTIDHFVVTAEFALQNQYRQAGEEPQGAILSPRPGLYTLFASKNLLFGLQTRRPAPFCHFRTFSRAAVPNHLADGWRERLSVQLDVLWW